MPKFTCNIYKDFSVWFFLDFYLDTIVYNYNISQLSVIDHNFNIGSSAEFYFNYLTNITIQFCLKINGFWINFALFSPHGEQKVNVGLNLKFNKKNEEVPGYTKRTEKEWLYSAAVEELLAEYLERCVCVFEVVRVWLPLFLCGYFNIFFCLCLSDFQRCLTL